MTGRPIQTFKFYQRNKKIGIFENFESKKQESLWDSQKQRLMKAIDVLAGDFEVIIKHKNKESETK